MIGIGDGRKTPGQPFHRLVNESRKLDQNEFEALIDHFGDRLTTDEVIALTVERIHSRAYLDSLEARLQLAIAEGRFDEATCLSEMIERRDDLLNAQLT